jgi:methionyl-tRNA synthetase
VLEERGLIEERVDQMVYSIDDKRFLPDRYIEGTCPHCGFEKARGDQCDNCGNLLDPTELKHPYSVISGSRNLEVRDTRHLYLLQTKLADQASGPGSTPARLAAAGQVDRLQAPGRGPDRSRHHPRPGLGHPGDQGRVPASEASRTRSSTSGSTRPSNTSPPTQEWAEAGAGSRLEVVVAHRRGGAKTSATSSSWARTTSPSTPSASPPPSWAQREEPWKSVDMLKAFNWLNWYGGKFSTSQQARRVHGRGPGAAAAGLLALVPDLQRAREQRHRLRLGAVPAPR